MLHPREPNRPTYIFLLLFATRRRCRIDEINIARGVVVAIVRRRPPSDFSKSMDPDESYGNAIVLIILKDALTTITFSRYKRVDAVTRC